LFLKLLCEAITQDDYAPEEIDQFLTRNTTLQDWYANYWERLEHRFEDRPDNLEQINAVIGAIAAAGGPVTRDQVCEALTCTPTLFDWCLRFIGQYLDVIPVTEAGMRQRGPRELVLYRLYHFSFREFVLARVHPDLAPFHTRWSYLLAHWRDLEGHERDYALRHLPRHLTEAQRWDELEALLTDLAFIEAKCAAGMVYELQTDYQAAQAALPEARAEREKEHAHQQRIARYIQELIAYAQAWSEARARYTAEPGNRPLPEADAIPLPDIIPSVRPWTDEQIQVDVERIMRHPTRLDRLRAFADFVASESHSFLKFAALPGFCLQQALNYADAGPVVEAAERFLRAGVKEPLLLLNVHQRAAYNPHPALLRTLEGHTSWVESVSLTPDGRTAVSGSGDETVRVWDLRTGQCLRTLEGHIGGVWSVSLTPDGCTAVSGSGDKTVRVWDLNTGQCGAIFRAAGNEVYISNITLGGQLGICTNGGQVVFVTLYGFQFGPITAIRLWLFVTRGRDDHWDDRLTALCEHCGQRCEPEPSVLDTIRSITAHLPPDQSPCLALPREAWNEPRLLSACPHCHKPVKFNPFIVDNRNIYEHGLLASIRWLFRRKDRL
jgi:hypothetical protein